LWYNLVVSEESNSIHVAEGSVEETYGSDVHPLENGDHLTASEFLRRLENMPELKKAELIQGIVYMASAVGFTHHAEPDGVIQGWLSFYASKSKDVRHATNSTLRLSPDDVVQPDGLLVKTDTVQFDEKGYLSGPVEFVAEIEASSASIVAREKLDTYRRSGVKEYLLWRTRDSVIEWWHLEDDDYLLLEPDQAGNIQSREFPGLALNVEPALNLDSAGVLSAL